MEDNDLQEIAQWLSPTDAARRLGVSLTRIHQLVEEGRLPSVKTALGRLIEPRGLERLLRERRQKAGKKGSRVRSVDLRVVEQ